MRSGQCGVKKLEKAEREMGGGCGFVGGVLEEGDGLGEWGLRRGRLDLKNDRYGGKRWGDRIREFGFRRVGWT
jgi:hypothetical protein